MTQNSVFHYDTSVLVSAYPIPGKDHQGGPLAKNIVSSLIKNGKTTIKVFNHFRWSIPTFMIVFESTKLTE